MNADGAEPAKRDVATATPVFGEMWIYGAAVLRILGGRPGETVCVEWVGSSPVPQHREMVAALARVIQVADCRGRRLIIPAERFLKHAYRYLPDVWH